jgi:hypothetical protein
LHTQTRTRTQNARRWSHLRCNSSFVLLSSSCSDLILASVSSFLLRIPSRNKMNFSLLVRGGQCSSRQARALGTMSWRAHEHHLCQAKCDERDRFSGHFPCEYGCYFCMCTNHRQNVMSLQYIHSCMHVYTCVHACMYAYTRTYAPFRLKFTYLHSYTHACPFITTRKSTQFQTIHSCPCPCRQLALWIAHLKASWFLCKSSSSSFLLLSSAACLWSKYT